MDKATVHFYLLIILSFVISLPKSKEFEGSLKLDSLDIGNPLRNDSISSSEMPAVLTTPRNRTLPCNQTKHEEFCKCRRRGLVPFDPSEYVITNGTAYILDRNASYGPLFYEIDGEDLLICKTEDMITAPTEELANPHSEVRAYITLTCLSMSVVCLSLHLVAFAMVPELRNIPGCCRACLCVSLLSGYISFLVGFDEYIVLSRDACVATAFSTHFFLLSSVLWMNVMAFDVLKSLLNATSKLRMMPSKFTFKNFYAYCLYAWGISLGFSIAALISDTAPNFPDEYKPRFGNGRCWFSQSKPLLLFFAAPVFTVICTNVLFFGLSIRIIVIHRMKRTDPQQGELRRHLVMYARLAVIIGLSWVSGLLATFLNQVILWDVFAVLNTLQGFFIFLAFTFTPKVKKQLSEMFGFYSRYSMQTSSHEKSSEITAKGKGTETN